MKDLRIKLGPFELEATFEIIVVLAGFGLLFGLVALGIVASVVGA